MLFRSPVRKASCGMGIFALLALAMALMVCGLTPRLAFADRSFTIDQVDIEATVNPDGSVDVLEYRTFDFDGQFNGVYWKIPTGSYGGRKIETYVSAVGEVIDGEFVSFEEAYDGENHTCELRDHGSFIEVKLYSRHEDESAVFVIGYTDTNLAARYDDVSELYWKFVSDGWDEESRNVTCTIHLPVPDGKKVEPEENVRAWGHGPLDGSVSFDGNDVVYTAPGVGSSEFAEARITFPTDWLSESTSLGGRVLQDILAEEQRWADEANASRQRARAMTYGAGTVGALATLGMVAGTVVLYIRNRRRHKPKFDDKYFRDVPSADHPAVLGALYCDGEPDSAAFTASLMRLTDLGCIKLDQVTVQEKGFFGSTKTFQDYRLTLTSRADEIALDPIDDKVIRMLFHTVYRARKPREDDNPNEVSILFSDLEKVAKKYPQRFEDAYDRWKDKVTDEVARRRFFITGEKTGMGFIVIMLVIELILIACSFALLVGTEAFAIYIPLLILQVLALAVMIVLTSKISTVSEEGRELQAQLKALKCWLEDFTRLGEAVPRDVVLWNRLLVMAVVLGVADKVIEQLQVTMPEILADPRLAPTYGWYYYGSAGRPYDRFITSYKSAHSVSASELASSSSSSGGGGGGGFSGGGGGGFGGGGGGGAF